MFSTKWVGAAMAIVLSANISSAAYSVAAGKIKSIDAENKRFVLTDSADKDFTFKIGEKVVINRAGKEVKSDLKVGDAINVGYDKGTLHWTAEYILVQEGSTKDCTLIHGVVKSYDSEKKELAFTDDDKNTTTYKVGDAAVRLNMEDVKIDDVKIGDHALLIVETIDKKSTLRNVMLHRLK